MTEEKPNHPAPETFNIGDILVAPKIGSLEHPFQGEIEKIYDHSLLVVITDNDVTDQPIVNEMNHRAVVSMADVEVIEKAKVETEEK